MPAFLNQPVPNREAASFIKDKPVVSREVFDGLLPEIKARAFVITGIEDANVVQAVRDRIAEIPQGADWDTVRADIADKISPWLAPDAGAKDDEGNPLSAAEREEKARAAGERRAELLLRGHGFQAYAAAQYEVMDRQRAAFPFWQYLTSQDDRVRDSHAALDGLVLPADSPFWATHFPPWDYGCRCQVVPLQAEDVADIEKADADKKPEERRVLGPERQAQLEKSGIVTRAINGEVPRPINVTPRADAPRFEPGTLKLDVAQLRERYDAPTFATFEKWAKATPLQAGADRSVFDWLAETKAPRTRKPTAARVTPAAPAAPAQPSPAEQEREAIRTADYTREQPLGGGVNSTVILTNGRKVVFKSQAGQYAAPLRKGIEQGTQYRREVAASIVDERLGLGLVPPTALLKRGGAEGSAQLFREGFRPAALFRDRDALVRALPPRVRHDWQLLDDLLANLDRHGNNYMLKPGVAGAAPELALIDHGLTLSSVAQPKRLPGPLDGARIDATNLARLSDFIAAEPNLRARLEPLIDIKAVDLLFERAKKLLSRKIYDIR
jgi:SPP1 gp7 family putative phage head morphogenesis protein